MILPRFRRSPDRHTIAALYGAIVAQARLPVFYAAYGVPDTANGRFDMILLHATLVLRRLRAGGSPIQALGQGVFDEFCRDMDDNLREMGTSDLGVPKKMRKLAQAFYGRAQAYDLALDQGDDAELAAALTRNIYAEVSPVAVAPLAAYVRETTRDLSEQSDETLSRSEVRFPDPEHPAAAAAE